MPTNAPGQPLDADVRELVNPHVPIDLPPAAVPDDKQPEDDEKEPRIDDPEEGTPTV